MSNRALVLLGFMCLTGCWSTEPKSREDVFVIEPVETPAFEKLPPGRRRLAYHVARALRAADNLHWYQASRDGAGIRDLLIDVWTNERAIPRRLRPKIRRYFARILAERGVYDRATRAKIVPEFTRAQFRKILRKVGKFRGQARAAQLQSRAEHVARPMFDPNDHTWAHGGAGFDGDGVTPDDLDTLAQSGLIDETTSVFKDADRVRTERPRIDGLYGQDVKLVDHHVREALQFANDREFEYLDRVRVALRTGFAAHWREAARAWERMAPTDLDFRIGPHGVTNDPHGRRQIWSGWIAVRKGSDVERSIDFRADPNHELLYAAGPVGGPDAGEEELHHLVVLPTLSLGAGGEVARETLPPSPQPLESVLKWWVAEARDLDRALARQERCTLHLFNPRRADQSP